MTHAELWHLSLVFKKTQSGFTPVFTPGGGKKWETRDLILISVFGRRKYNF